MRWRGNCLRLPGGDLEDLGRHSDGSLDSEVLVLGPVDQVVGDYRADNNYKHDEIDKVS